MSLVREHAAPGVLRLRLSRPQRLNALTLPLAQELLATVRAAIADESVRVILLTGEGRAFCAGKDRDDPPTAEFVEVLQRLASALMHAPQPVVAAVQGWAVGAGLELLLNCDIVVAAQGTRFMLPETRIGVFGTGGVLALLPRVVGLMKAKGLLMLSREMTAAQAEQWGLVWEVVEEAQLEERALALAGQLAASRPAILAEIKALLHREVLGDLQAALAREAQAHGRLGVR